jgi:hypothetical protein
MTPRNEPFSIEFAQALVFALAYATLIAGFIIMAISDRIDQKKEYKRKQAIIKKHDLK